MMVVVRWRFKLGWKCNR